MAALNRRKLPFMLTAAVMVFLFAAAAVLPGGAAAVYAADEPFVVLSSTSETWADAPIGPGTTLSMKEIETTAGPQRIGRVTVDLAHPLVGIKAAPAGSAVPTRTTVAHQAERDSAPGHQVIAAVNGDFFDTSIGFNGVPTGLMLVDGELTVNPWGPAVGIMPDKSVIIGTPRWEARLEILNEHGHVVASRKIDGINRRRDADRLILYTPAFGGSTGSNEYGAEAVLTGIPLPVSADYSAAGPVDSLFVGEGMKAAGGVHAGTVSAGDTPIPGDGVVISGHGEAAAFLLDHVHPGRHVRLAVALDAPWNEIEYGIGGRPVLVSDGRIAPDVDGGPLAGARAPRTAVGIDKDGNFVMVTADGRQTDAAGLTLMQFARLLMDMGITEAINLDGGGSTTMYARPPGLFDGTVVNAPSDGASRRVANSLQVISRAPVGTRVERFWLEQPASALLTGSTVSMSARAQDEYFGPVAVNPHQVDWSALSDGGEGVFSSPGRFTGLEPGAVTVIAAIDGVADEVTLEVLAPEQLGEVKLRPSPALSQWRPGLTVTPGLEGYDGDGGRVIVSADSLVWEADPGLGTVDTSGRLRINPEDGARGVLRVSLNPLGPGSGAGEDDSPDADGSEDGGDHRPEDLIPLAAWSVTVDARTGGSLGHVIRMFPDTVHHWAGEDIGLLAGRGVVTGYPDGTFNPDGQVTRAEMVKMMVGALEARGTGLPGTGNPGELPPFADEDSIPDWVAPFLAGARRAGLISGYDDGTFKPGGVVTRQEAVVMLIRSADLAGIPLPPFPAASGAPGGGHDGAGDGGEGAGESGEEAGESGEEAGGGGEEAGGSDDGSGGGGEKADGGEGAGGGDTGPAGDLDFTDAHHIGDWAYEQVWRAHAARLVTGFEDGTFQPGGGLTRAQAAALLVRLMGW